MLELDCPIMTPEEVLKTSGHVDRFSDWMCRDVQTGEIFRADHILEKVLEGRLEGHQLASESAEPASGTQKAPKKDKKKAANMPVKLDTAVKQEYEEILNQIDNYTGAQLGQLIRKLDVRAPESGNELSEPVEFNLMFESLIGPTGQLKGYLRPETAQGQFLVFKKLLEFNNERMPFASAQIGRSFRNEISPRSGLLRVREFTMAEIEHYVDPLNKKHSRFHEMEKVVLELLPASTQLQGKNDILHITVGEAVAKGIVDNETLGYFLARIYLFLQKIGVDPKRTRFRQHMKNEMAHYACDCWDAEILTSYGWIECVGCADRSAYDLTVHSKRTKEKLVVRQSLEMPVKELVWQCVINKKIFGPKFKKGAKELEDVLLGFSQAELEHQANQLRDNGYLIIIFVTNRNATLTDTIFLENWLLMDPILLPIL